MWKRLKLLTLVVLTVLLAWVTYPTWQSLITPQQAAPDLAYDDRFQVIVSKDSDYRLEVSLISTFKEDGQFKQDVDTNLDITVGGATSSPVEQMGEPVYILTSGEASGWMDRCQTAHEEYSKWPEASPDQVPPGIREFYTRSPTEKVVTKSFYLLARNHLRCKIATDKLWFRRDSARQFVAPAIEATGEPESIKNYSMLKHCVNVAVRYPGKFALIYQSAQAKPMPLAESSLLGYSTSWQDCEQEGPALYSSVEASYLAINNMEQNIVLNRNLFFAGAFAGILGALVIEIFNGSFDGVAEHWSARRRTRRDEQEQRPEPKPYPPKPDDEVDRDQLPLF